MNSRGPFLRGASSSFGFLPSASADQGSPSPTRSASRRSRRRSSTARPPWGSASRTAARPWGISGGRGNACHGPRPGGSSAAISCRRRLAVLHISILTAAATKMRSTRGSSAACFSKLAVDLRPVPGDRPLVRRPHGDRLISSRSRLGQLQAARRQHPDVGIQPDLVAGVTARSSARRAAG